jgi:hypothetical protein
VLTPSVEFAADKSGTIGAAGWAVSSLNSATSSNLESWLAISGVEEPLHASISLRFHCATNSRTSINAIIDVSIAPRALIRNIVIATTAIFEIQLIAKESKECRAETNDRINRPTCLHPPYVVVSPIFGRRADPLPNQLAAKRSQDFQAKNTPSRIAGGLGMWTRK